MPAAVVGVAIIAVIGYLRSEELSAAGGSRYYGKAVQEAIAGLKNPEAKAPVARPPLPAGLSADEHYWCEQCRAYHKRQPAQAQPAQATLPLPGEGPPAPLLAPPPAATIPPLPAGLAAADHYWCPNCKVYHKRQADQAQPTVPSTAAPVVPPVSGTPGS